MRYILLFLIQIYWLKPKRKRKKCIFKETCSQYIYRKAKSEGLVGGLLSIRERKQKCRPGYYYLDESNVRLADGSIIASNLLRESIL